MRTSDGQLSWSEPALIQRLEALGLKGAFTPISGSWMRGTSAFFVSFLSEQDLAERERQLPPVARRELRDVGPAFPATS